MPVVVRIDSREVGARYIDFLEQRKDAQIEYAQLPSADIVINDLGIERKTVDDFFATLDEGWLFSQLRTLKLSYRRQLLLIEGAGMRTHLDEEPFFGLYVRIAAGWQIPILHTRNGEQTAQCLHRICHQDAFASAGPVRCRPRNPAYDLNPVSVRILLEIPGVGPTKAAALLAHFGSLERIFGANPKELRKVAGIGKARAHAIEAANRQL